MRSSPPISGSDLSMCWRTALSECRRGHISGLLVDIIAPVTEDRTIRSAIDYALVVAGCPTVHETADTIFPEFLWRRCLTRSGLSATDVTVRQRFYTEYFNRFLPAYRARRTKLRHAGLRETYFQRFADYTGTPDVWSQNPYGNQVERCILAIQHDLRLETPRSPRVSALALSVFDPRKDYPQESMNIRPLCGFPCLQQVSIEVVRRGVGAERAVRLHAMYPLEYIMDRAYGNYLGLSQLGAFIAESCGLACDGVSVYVAKAEIGNMGTAPADSILNPARVEAASHV